jgi:hypothetical protein
MKGMVITMREYVKDYLNFISTLREEYSNSSASLKCQDRKDEANLYKVRINICDIFTTLAGTAEKKVASMKLALEAEQIKAFNSEYMNLFEQIPANWITNLEKAKKFNDAVTVKTEEVKLETVQILKSKFTEITCTN